LTKTTKERILDYLKTNPWNPSATGQYSKIANAIGSSSEAVRKCIRKHNLAPKLTKIIYNNGGINTPTSQDVYIDNERYITMNGDEIPTCEEDVIKKWNIDLDKWSISKMEYNTWGTPDNLNKQCKVHLVKIVTDVQIIPTLKKIEMPTVIFKPNKIYAGKNKKTMIIGDSQVGFRRNLLTNELEPFHDRKSMDLALQIIKHSNADEVVLLGDMLDFTEASDKFLKEPEFYITTQSSLMEFGLFLQKLRDFFDGNIYYLEGNHEKRVKISAYKNMMYAYTLKKTNHDYSILSVRNLLDLDKLGITYFENYPQDSYWINDNLRAVHGEYINLKKELANSRISTIQGHKHSIEKKFKTSHGRDGSELMFVESVGCLCRIDGTVPGMTSQPDWQQGMLEVDTINGKYFDTHSIIFHSGKAIYNGSIFEGVDNTTEVEKLFNRI
jgi:predicted MPP superfamily phosphohydrolase